MLVLGCSPSVTEIVVVADTDLSVPDGVDAIRISVSDPQFRLQEAHADLAGGAPRPVTLGLVSESGEGTLEVVVIGERGGIEILRRTARVSFQRGRTLVLRMDLWDRCIAEICGAGRACGDAGCRPIDIDPSELTEWTGSPPGPPDAAVVPDGGPDGGVPDEDGAVPEDAELMDAGIPEDDAWVAPTDSGPPIDGGRFADAGVEDASTGEPDASASECSSAAECNDGFPCTADSCDLGRCVHAASDAICSDGIACTTERCDLALGCVYDASDAACDDGVACSINTCDLALGCVTSLSHTSCGLGSYCDGAAGCTAGPTFTSVYAVLASECGPCHTTSPSRGGDLDFGTQSVAYAAMVGVTAVCGAGVNTRVIPRDPARSLLWRKVAAVDLCGTRMPRMSTPLSDANIEMIRLWIAAGAVE
jgi:hypothetical protein